MTSIIKAEEQILKFWEQDNTFVKSNLSKSKEFVFFEGPPFATGLPHYGHVLAGLIKDTMCRWACQSGHQVTRRATWDSHGLPIEYEIEKAHGIKTKQEILAFGIPAYNQACESIVLRYSNQWEQIIGRLGRWIDWESNIKTMDLEYMNKVWYIFASIYSQGLIYEDFKVMPYSNACTTPLSNFEASSNYQNVTDQTVIVEFELVGSANKILVWTTTPWTLPANQALCVNPELTYLLVELESNHVNYWVCSGLVESVFKTACAVSQFTVKSQALGSELAGLEYYNLFDHNKIQLIYADTYVNDQSGTGIVHLAPGFGEDDYRVCKSNGFGPADIYIPLDDSGFYIAGTKPDSIQGLDIKSGSKLIIKELKTLGVLFETFQYTHSYPFCWRSDTPLIYKAVSSWFLKVSDIKEQLVKASSKTNWVPQNVRDGRFHNWLSDAKDWCLSRNRFWGTPIPIWKSSCGKVIVVSSTSELEQLGGLAPGSISNAHRHHVDQIVIKKDGIEYRRVEQVLDCWFESGSIPFVLSSNPNPQADFIAEGLDQTRGWFYTLLVISTCLSGQAPFKNVIVNGIVNASDGKKMSKRLKNYPDPLDIVKTYGADALRLYLITSVASKGESIKFKEEEVRQMMQNIILPLTNSFAFYFEYETKFKLSNQELVFGPTSNPLDHWVIDLTHRFVQQIQNSYSSYTLQPIYNLLIEYIDKLNNGYLRLNREHLKSDSKSLAVFKYVLELCILHLAPVLPFLTEHFNLKLGSTLSIHCKEFDFIQLQVDWIDQTLVAQSTYLLKVLDMIRSLRGNLPRKKPIKKAILKVLPQMFPILNDLKMKEFISNETNILELEVIEFVPSVKIYNIKPNFSVLGSKSKQYGPIIKSLTQEQIALLITEKLIQVSGLDIDLTQVLIDISIPSGGDSLVSDSNDELQLGISLDLTQDEQTELVYIGKTVAREYQQLRKETGLHPWDPIKLVYMGNTSLTEPQLQIITKSTGHTPIHQDLLDGIKIIGLKQIEILSFEATIALESV